MEYYAAIKGNEDHSESVWSDFQKEVRKAKHKDAHTVSYFLLKKGKIKI